MRGWKRSWAAKPRLAPERLEERIAPATLLAVDASHRLLRFDSASPGTIDATVAITGLGSGESIVDLDARPEDGSVYALTIDANGGGRLYTLDLITGAATFGRLLAADAGDATAPYTALSGTQFGIDFDPVADRLRIVGATGQNLAVDVATGAVVTDPAAVPGVGIAFSQSFPGATGTTRFAIDSTTDKLFAGTSEIGALGVDVQTLGGFDVSAQRSLAGETAFAALRSGGVTRLHLIDLATGSAATSAAIGDGTNQLRGLTVLLNVWDGGAANANWSTAANWSAGLVPKPGEPLIFPKTAAQSSTNNDLAAGTNFAFAVLAANYTLNGNAVEFGDGILATHASGEAVLNLPVTMVSNTGQNTVLRVLQSAATLRFAAAGSFEVMGPPGFDVAGAGTVTIESDIPDQLNLTPNRIEAGAHLKLSGANGFTNDLDVDSTLTVNGSQPAAGTIHLGPGSLLEGGGVVGNVVTAGGIVAQGTAASRTGTLQIAGNLTLDAAAQMSAVIEGSATRFTVAGSVNLAGAELQLGASANIPTNSFTLISQTGTGVVTGTFKNLPEGELLTVGSEFYLISYRGGDGNDVVLTRTSAPPQVTLGKDFRSATFTDVDGDRVTVTTSKGTFSADQFKLRAAGLGASLEKLTLPAGDEFSQTNLTITAARQDVTGDRVREGNGQVKVVVLDATGLDLGTVKISGELGELKAGDSDGKLPGLLGLDLVKFGDGTPRGSVVQGGIGKVNVRSSLDGVTLQVVGGTTAGVKDFNVAGDFNGQLEVAGPLGSFRARDVADASVIRSAAPAIATALTFHRVGDGVTIEIAGAVSSLRAAEIRDATITADRLATLTVTGNRAAGLRGDFLATLILDNGGATATGRVLGTTRIAGLVQGASFSIAGNVGAFTVAGMINSTLFAGFTPTTANDPLAGGVFVSGGIKSFNLTGRFTAQPAPPVSFDDSFVVAAQLGSVTIAAADTVTGNTLWGFAYRDSVKSLKIKQPQFAYNVKTGGTQAADDFQVRKLG